jgi:hypothetical protein
MFKSRSGKRALAPDGQGVISSNAVSCQLTYCKPPDIPTSVADSTITGCATRTIMAAIRVLLIVLRISQWNKSPWIIYSWITYE